MPKLKRPKGFSKMGFESRILCVQDGIRLIIEKLQFEEESKPYTEKIMDLALLDAMITEAFDGIAPPF